MGGYAGRVKGDGGAAAVRGAQTADSKREKQKTAPVEPGMANDEMCVFLIINISSLQLIPVNIIAYRGQYGSVNPAAIVGPGLLATICSTLAADCFL